MVKKYLVKSLLSVAIEVDNTNNIIDEMDKFVDDLGEEEFLDNTSIECITDEKMLSREEVRTIFFGHLN